VFYYSLSSSLHFLFHKHSSSKTKESENKKVGSDITDTEQN